MDIITLALSKGYTNKVLEELGRGLVYKGSVATTSDLPTASSSNKGWMYTITANGHEYVSDGTQWVDLGADLDSKLDKAVPTTEQGTKEYLYTFAGTTQKTDVALINDMSSGSSSYTDEMVPTAKSVALVLEDKVDSDKIASTTELGMVKVGNGLKVIASTGVMSLNDDVTVMGDLKVRGELDLAASGASLGTYMQSAINDVVGSKVSSIGGSTGAVTLGTNLSMSGQQLQVSLPNNATFTLSGTELTITNS